MRFEINCALFIVLVFVLYSIRLNADPGLNISSAIIPGKSMGPFMLGISETETVKLAKKLGLTAEIDKEDEVGPGFGISKGTVTIIIGGLDTEVGEGKVTYLFTREPYFYIKNTNLRVGSPFRDAVRIFGKNCLLTWDEGWCFLFKSVPGLILSIDPSSMRKHIYEEDEYLREVKNSTTTKHKIGSISIISKDDFLQRWDYGSKGK